MFRPGKAFPTKSKKRFDVAKGCSGEVERVLQYLAQRLSEYRASGEGFLSKRYL